MRKIYIPACLTVLLVALAACSVRTADYNDVASSANWEAEAIQHTLTPVITTSTAIKEPAPAETQPTATPEPCPITDDEILMLAKVITKEAEVVYWDGDQYGVTYLARQAAVGWCGLNRLDAGFAETLEEVLSAPYQFEYHEDTEVADDMLLLANDIVQRWWAEKQGASDVGRTLPADYLFFYGDGRENHFRKEFETDEVWDWSLPDPYID